MKITAAVARDDVHPLRDDVDTIARPEQLQQAARALAVRGTPVLAGPVNEAFADSTAGKVVEPVIVTGRV